MKQRLIDILNKYGYPVMLQGSLNPEEEYPESFFTFWNFETPEAAFYDNAAGRAVWGFWVYFYSADPAKVDTILERARQSLIENGFITSGKGEDVASDVTTHTGRMIEIYGIEEYQKG